MNLSGLGRLPGSPAHEGSKLSLAARHADGLGASTTSAMQSVLHDVVGAMSPFSRADRRARDCRAGERVL